MHRTDAPNHVANLFVDRDPIGGTPGTIVDDDWLNAVQEEVVYVIEQAGIVLAKGTNTQLRQAIQTMLTDSQKRIALQNAVFEGTVADGDMVYWDNGNSRFDKAKADGTVLNRAVGVADVTNSKVIAYGESDAVFAGLTPGARYFLDATTAGDVADAPPPDRILVGIAKTATTMFVDIDPETTDYTPPMSIQGLVIANNGADAAKDIDIAPGEARDTTDVDTLVLAAALTKQIDASWAVGTDAGGLDGTESVPGTPDADTWYHVWLIKRSDTGVVDVLFSESATAPTMPTNYDLKRRIGSVLTDGSSNIIAFNADEVAGGGTRFRWKTRILDYNANWSTGGTLVPLSVPLGLKVHTILVVWADSASNLSYLITGPDETDSVPSSSAHDFVTHSSSRYASAEMQRTTDINGQIRERATGTGVLRIFTLGWIDNRII